MADQIPYIIPITFVVASQAQQDFVFTSPANQRTWVEGWLWNSTSTFIVYDIAIQTNIRYTNANLTTGIKSTFLQSPLNAFLALRLFQIPLKIEPNTSLFIRVKDTSGAGNTIDLVLLARQDPNVA